MCKCYLLIFFYKLSVSLACFFVFFFNQFIGLSRFLNFFFFFFRATPMAYGDYQPGGQIRAATAGLHHSHSNVGSQLSMPPTPQLRATPDPYPTEQGQGSKLRPHGYQSDLLTTEPRKELFFLIFMSYLYVRGMSPLRCVVMFSPSVSLVSSTWLIVFFP